MSMLSKLTHFAKLERIIATVCIFMPLLLKWADDNEPFRESISDYVYMFNGHIYGLLLTLASMLFVFNGTVYIKKNKRLPHSKRHGKWYNIVLGLALLGILLFPHREYTIIHYSFAALFFGGSALVIGIFNDRRHRAISIVIAAVSILGLILYLIDESIISLFWAEWISLFVIAIHYILESKGILD
ncbi:DUF7103 family protein [Tenacibaculum sp. M341]|uniref:DUF7103 family protein n=1 Tax=Tenacibaculum sp. M341 TaxID=2530339 RepID=UPI001053A40A|nr:hypothetical protein [Tenacibaculum sp. M341]TCI94384.1 hypothetical protein EYW44_03295 [Tenacibaculum sp. M341]